MAWPYHTYSSVSSLPSFVLVLIDRYIDRCAFCLQKQIEGKHKKQYVVLPLKAETCHNDSTPFLCFLIMPLYIHTYIHSPHSPPS